MKKSQIHIIISISFLLTLAILVSSCKTTPKVSDQLKDQIEPTISKSPAEIQEDIEEDLVFTKTKFAEQLTYLLSNGKEAEALALFDTIPEPDASDFSIRMLKLSLLVSFGNITESESLAKELEIESPGNPELSYIQALIATLQNNQTNRTKYLNQSLKLNPNHVPSMIALGSDYITRKNYTQAKKNLLNALKIEPTNTEALLGLARVYYMENSLNKAEDALNLAIEQDPSFGSLWAERARVRSESNDLGGAIKDVQKAVELESNVYRHWIDLGTYYISYAKKQEAKDAFTKAIEVDSEHHLAYIYRAGLNDDLGNKEQAIQDYKKICTVYPQYFYAAESLGVLLWEKQDWKGAETAFKQALYYSPKNTSYALMATAAMYKENKPQDAKKFMSQYITSLDRTSTDYFLCRLFVDRSGEMDVLNRVLKEKNETKKKRMLFYNALYYDIFQSQIIAQQYYLEVVATKNPSFFEYRLCEHALKRINNARAENNLNTLES